MLLFAVVIIIIATAVVGMASSDKKAGVAIHYKDWGPNNFNDYKDKIKSFDVVRDGSWWISLEGSYLDSTGWKNLDDKAVSCKTNPAGEGCWPGWIYEWPPKSLDFNTNAVNDFCNVKQKETQGYDQLVSLYQDPNSPDLLLLLSIKNDKIAQINSISPVQYQDYVSHVVERYDKDNINDMPDLKKPVRYFEIGNEVDLLSNSGLDHAYMTPENYVNKRLIPGYKAAKRANPNSIVMGAGLGMHTESDPMEFSTEYLKGIYEAVKKDPDAVANNFYMDRIAMHYYIQDANPEFINENIAKVKQLIKSYEGKDKPIWITEFGAPFGNGNVISEEEDQAGILTRYLSLMYFNNIEMPIIYQITGETPGNTVDDLRYGTFYRFPCQKGNIVFTQTKSLTAKDTISKILDGSQPIISESNIPGSINMETAAKDGFFYDLVFRNPDIPGKKISVLWYTKIDGTGQTDEKTTIKIPVGSNSVKLMDMYGNSLPPIIINNNGINEVKLDIGEKPKYLILSENIPIISENRPGFLTGIFNIITKAIELFNEYIRIPEAHSAPPTPVLTYTPTITITPTPMKTPSSYSGSTFTNSIDMEFVLLPAGEFDMGSPWNEAGRSDSEGPVHHVKISNAFYMGKYEVTQKQWRDVMGSSPSNFKGDNLPVEQVSWNDVQEFIKKLNGKEGTNKYRLPSEAEWEYAARSGTTTKYSFGDDESLGDYAWSDNSGSKTHDVGQKKPNPWGLYDMHGNVWEWVQDNWHDNYNDAPTDGSSWERRGSDRVNRGGGWYYNTGGCRSASRGFNGQDTRSNALGFRLLRVS